MVSFLMLTVIKMQLVCHTKRISDESLVQIITNTLIIIIMKETHELYKSPRTQ